jgi:hypothetical protein
MRKTSPAALCPSSDPQKPNPRLLGGGLALALTSAAGVTHLHSLAALVVCPPTGLRARIEHGSMARAAEHTLRMWWVRHHCCLCEGWWTS